jgi:hypothetical protein
MKGAAKCDKHCELQNSVNQQGLERILRFRDIPESMPASVSIQTHSFERLSFDERLRVIVIVLFETFALTRLVHGAGSPY